MKVPETKQEKPSQDAKPDCPNCPNRDEFGNVVTPPGQVKP